MIIPTQVQSDGKNTELTLKCTASRCNKKRQKQLLSPTSSSTLTMSSIAEGKKSFCNISRHELFAIQQMVAPPEERETIWDRKRELQKKSTDKVSRWPNTLAARRKHKEAARSLRLAQLEADRRVNDKKLAEERALDRKKRIDRANRTIYERTDRMKVLRSKRMSVDILKHRDIQIRQKKQFSSIDVEIDKLWHSETIRQCAEYDKKEEAAVSKVKARDKAIAVIQTKQLEDYKDRYIEQLLAERDEGLAIAKNAVAGAEKDRQKGKVKTEKHQKKMFFNVVFF